MVDINTQRNLTIGHNLKTLRKAAGLSLQDVAALLYVSYQQVQKYEAGKNRLPADSIAVLCDVFGVSFEHFLGVSAAAGWSDDRLALYAAFNRLRDPLMRRKVIGIIDILASA